MRHTTDPGKAWVGPRGTALEAVIESTCHPAVRRVADVLRTPSGAQRVILIDDEENIAQALRCGIRFDSLYATIGMESAVPEIFIPAGARHVPMHLLSERTVKELFGNDKRSRVFALAHRPRRPTLGDLSDRDGDIVVLDGVRLAGNIGAITRTACALGAAGVVLLDSGLTSVLDRRLIRASRGLVFSLPVVLASRQELRDYLRQQGISVAGLAVDASTPLNVISTVRRRLALLIGGERTGTSDDMDVLAEHRYRIPMTSGVESFNVSVATGIALYERREGRMSRWSETCAQLR
ncbi:NshR/TsnR family 23S rRNA methyltransferase [Nonomuraea sp. SMC257]|uniref:NshR/TsnR family 23S rRNA methyltransferase n=1 Tax=Nonomuraea montanisoli TaxID=2741721 RepID=A0A7Y6I7D8_9ACTN|nr:TrmH family RNA methyltransferase [Nonomuraea montanisoli]NUW33073.1 NshR/TsnR family 23S rRNA methyltransferase [Nonomuraea montanisoli]